MNLSRLIRILTLLTTLLLSAPAFAQVTAPPAQIGYLSTTGCSYGLTTCFVQYGASIPVTGTVAGSQSNAGAGTTGSTNVPVMGYNYYWTGAAWAQWLGKVGIDQTTPGTTNGVQTLSGSVTSTTPNPSTHVQCAALCTSLVAKASAGTLQSFEVSADPTLAGAAWWLLIYDATSKPTDGAVTPAKCYAYPSGTTSAGGTFTESGVTFTTGITLAVSTTGCFTSTSSTHAFLAGDYR